MPNNSPHPYDGIAQDLFDWMTGEVDYYVDALKGGHRAPFAADASPKERYDYFSRKMFNQNPDGSPNYASPNQQGRDELMHQYGTAGYAEIAKGVMPKQGIRPELETGADPLAGQMPTDAADQEMSSGEEQ
jgi:hypothetical protein